MYTGILDFGDVPIISFSTLSSIELTDSNDQPIYDVSVDVSFVIRKGSNYITNVVENSTSGGGVVTVMNTENALPIWFHTEETENGNFIEFSLERDLSSYFYLDFDNIVVNWKYEIDGQVFEGDSIVIDVANNSVALSSYNSLMFSTGEYMHLDGYTATTKSVIIPSNIMVATFSGNSQNISSNLTISVADRTQRLVLIFKNFKYKAPQGKVALDCKDDNKKAGEDGFIVSVSCFGEVSIQGGMGKDGTYVSGYSNVKNGSTTYDGRNGKDGYNGQDGGAAVLADVIAFIGSGKLVLEGGAGGNGTVPHPVYHVPGDQ